MRFSYLILTLLIFNTRFCFSQDGIFALGKVIDSQTEKGIKAYIRYSSLPTGSITGKFNDSLYSFSIFGAARYQVTVEAEGYKPKSIIIDPQKMVTGNQIIQNITLTPSGEIIKLRNLIFEQGKATIATESYNELDKIVEMMNDNPKMIIQLEGHTDNNGDAKANLKLSESRVEAVRNYLTDKEISKRRIKTKAFGGSKPLRNEMTPEERLQNRRVEIRILKN